MGWLQPSTIPLSMSSALATPSPSTKKASLSIGHRIRLTAKAGASLTTIVSLPSDLPHSRAILSVSSEVS